MGRLIEAEALLRDMVTCCASTQFGRATAKMCIKRAPTVDAVEVVRCGECKFRCDFTDGHCECRRWPNVPMSYQRVDPNFDFCSYGEWKDGES